MRIPTIEGVLISFKKALEKEKVYYRRYSMDISSLILKLEISTKKLKAILHLLSPEDYKFNEVIGNEHILFFGKKINAKELLIGIDLKLNPPPLFVYLKFANTVLKSPHKIVSHDSEISNKKAQFKITKEKNTIPKG